MKKRLLYIILSVAFPALICAPALAAAPNQHAKISSHPGFHFNHRHHNALAGTTSVTSENWSGYAVTGSNGAFNNVASSWVQPTLNCAATPKASYSSYWVGLDGYSNSTVEQIGTEADCLNHQPVYGAWYEMYPNNPYEVSVRLTIHPGDKMTATVNYQPAITTTTIVRGRTRTTTTKASYVLSLNDTTSGKSYSTTVTPRQTYARSSAEVVTEAPYSGGILPLADFNTMSYSSTTVNGAPMGSLPNLQDVIMQNPAGMVATPSAFDVSNEGFGVTWSDS